MLATSSAVLRLSSDPNLSERFADTLSWVLDGQRSHERRLQTMNALPEECLRIDRPRRSGHSLPLEAVPPVEIAARADAFPLPEIPFEGATTRNSIRGRLIVIGFVAATPIAIGAWLWLLGRVALALL
jgi:hypothetical protein